MENEDYGVYCPAEIIPDKGVKPYYTANSPYDADAVYFMQKYALKVFPENGTVAIGVVSLALAVISAVMGLYLITIVSGLVLIGTMFSILTVKKSAGKIYEKLYKDEALRRYNFYSDHFTIETVKGAEYFLYDRVKKFDDTEKYIVLVMTDGRIYTISKKYIENNSLKDFIKEKLKG